MKKLLLISLMIFAICLVGCEEKKTEETMVNSVENQAQAPEINENSENEEKKVDEVVENNEELQVENVENATTSKANDILNMSFEERTKEARDYMNLDEDEYGISNLGYISSEHFISGGSIIKNDNYYLLKIQCNSSKLFDKEEIENAYKMAQENGTYDYEEYTFFKDNELPILEEYLYEEDNLNYIKEELLPSMKQKGILARSDEHPYLIFMNVPNDESKYCLAEQMIAGAEGFIITEIEKEILVPLLSEDKIVIRLDDGDYHDKELTVQDYYDIGSNGDIYLTDESNEEYSYLISINNMGDSSDHYGGYKNAISFDDDRVIINYRLGGV